MTWWQDHLALFAVVVGGGRHYLFALVVDAVGVFSRFSQLMRQNAFRMGLHFVLFYFSPLFSLADQLLQVGVDTVYFNLVRKQHYHIVDPGYHWYMDRPTSDPHATLIPNICIICISPYDHGWPLCPCQPLLRTKAGQLVLAAWTQLSL